jgi:adenylate cyclase
VADLTEEAVMTDAERERYLRRLRFPRELEQAFQADHYAKSRRLLQAASALVAVLFFVLGLYTVTRPHFSAGLPYVEWSACVVVLLVLALTFARGFARVWQPFIVVLGIGIGLIQLPYLARAMQMRPVPHESPKYFWFLLITFLPLLLFFILSRLQLRCAVILGCAWVGIWTWSAVSLLEWPAEDLMEVLGVRLLPYLLCLVFGAYMIERLERSTFLANHLLALERARSEKLLQNVLPEAIADRLKNSRELIADDHSEATVLFADLVGFTPMSAQKSAHEVVQFLNEVFSRFDHLVEAHGLEKIKTVGDCYMVVAGAPTARADHVEAAARLALAMRAEAEQLSQDHGIPIRFRIGLQTGPLVAGVIGEKRFLYDVWGDTVNTASRLESHGIPGAIQVSAEVAERLQGRFLLRRRGEVEIKGKGLMETYFLEGEAVQSRNTDQIVGRV